LLCSVDEFVSQRVSIPHAILVKHKDLLGGHVSEYHLLLVHVHLPQQWARHHFRFDFLQILDVYIHASLSAEEMRLVEHYLLCVG
jgi:hypothetical protein